MGCLNLQRAQPVTVHDPSVTGAEERYNNFLRSKGIDPNSVGSATVVHGRMVAPTIEEQYAAQK